MNTSEILAYVFGSIVSIVTAASVAAKFIDPLSKIGQWVAWVASCPIGHSPRIIAPVLLPTTEAKKSKAITDAMVDSGRVLVLLLALGTLPLLNGCALFRGAVVAGQAACQSELVNAPDVITEAKVRGVSVSQLVDAFCGLVDVAAIFTAEPKPGVARQAMTPRDQAVTLLRAKGEVK